MRRTAFILLGALLAVCATMPQPVSGDSSATTTVSRPTAEDLSAVTGTWDGDIYACGKGGTLIHFDGTTWSHDQSLVTFGDLHALWGTCSSVYVIAGSSGNIFMRQSSGAWVGSTPTPYTVRSLWGPSTLDLFAAGDYGTIMHYDGTAWSAAQPSPAPGIDLYCIWGSSPSNIWAGGTTGRLIHYTGAGWESVTLTSITGQTIRALWGESSQAIFAAGDMGHVLFFDGTAWTKILDTNGRAIYALWGTSSDDVFASGENGAIYHFDGSSWSSLASGTGYDLKAAWGSTSGKVFFVGDGGTVIVLTRSDTFAPTIIDTYPKDGAKDVPTTAHVTFTISEALDAASVTPGRATLTCNDTEVLAAVSVSDNTVTITPSSALSPGTIYRATLSGVVNDPAGNPLGTPCVITFTTASSASGGEGSDASGCFITACTR